MKDKLFDPRYVGVLGLVFLLISFVDVLFITDANSIAGMTAWGKLSVWGFILTLGWLATFMFLIPLYHKIFKK